MAIRTTVTYTRPDSSTGWHSASSAARSARESYVNSLQEQISDDSLIMTITAVFATQENYDSYKNDADVLSDAANRDAHNSANNITRSGPTVEII